MLDSHDALQAQPPCGHLQTTAGLQQKPKCWLTQLVHAVRGEGGAQCGRQLSLMRRQGQQVDQEHLAICKQAGGSSRTVNTKS